MARTAYYAPGVYVEEVPSARQPIAGVGTNTVGFIGLVPDRIYVPVANPDYDPVLTRDLLELARRIDQGPEKDPIAEMERKKAISDELDSAKEKIRALDVDIANLTGQQAELKAAVDAATTANTQALEDSAQLGPEPTPEAERKARTALRSAQRALASATDQAAASDALLKLKTSEREDVNAQIEDAKASLAATPPASSATASDTAGAAATSAKVSVEQEDDAYQDGTPDPKLLKPSVLRPYYLVEHKVKAGALATKLCTNFSEYVNLFGNFSAFSGEAENKDESPGSWRFRPLHPGHHLLTHAVKGFFDNGGTRAFVARVTDLAHWDDVLQRFESIDDVAIIAAPGLPKGKPVWEELQKYCEHESHQNVFAVLDSPAVVNDGVSNDFEVKKLQYDGTESLLPRKSTHAALYFPWVEAVDSAKRLQDSDPARNVSPKYAGLTYVAPSGHIAGIYARTDEERGVHKAPANTTVRGALEVKYYVSKPKQELLNPQGVNCIRLLNGSVTVWGARTMGGDMNGEWKYVSVRRFAGFLEESIDQGTQWVVFEPNDPNLWSKIILNITAFLTNVWRSGALFGLTPQEAFYVKCDAELNPPEVRDLGQVITEIGVAIVRPAEFVIFRISQSSGERQG